jgi:hypothetical protein
MLGDTTRADGRGLAIAADASSQRLFLLGNNRFIFVLSPEFMKIQNVTSLLRLRGNNVVTEWDPTPVPAGPYGSFQIKATFENVSGQNICNMFFELVEFSVVTSSGIPIRQNSLEAIQRESAEQMIQNFDQMLIGHQPLDVPANSDVPLKFTIDLDSPTWFTFLVNAWGTLQPLGSGCTSPSDGSRSSSTSGG